MREILYSIQDQIDKLVVKCNQLQSELHSIKLEKNKFESLYNNSPNGYFTFDQNGIITEVNTSGHSMLSYKKEDMLNKIFHLFIVREYWDVFNSFFFGLFHNQNKQSCELKLIDKNGQTFWVMLESIMVVNDQDGILQCRTSVSNISLLKKVEHDLIIRTEELKKAQLISNMGNWIWNIQEESLTCSDQIYRIFDLPIGDVNLTPSYFFKKISFSTKKNIISKFNASIKYNTCMELDIEFIKADSNSMIINFLAKTFHDNHGDVIGFNGIIQDITERKKIEEKCIRKSQELAESKILIEENAAQLHNLNLQLQKSELELKNINKNKDQFFAIISHNLKNPFSALLGYSDILLQDLKSNSDDSLHHLAQKINESSNRIYGLLDNLLKWSKIQFCQIECNKEKINLEQVTRLNLKLLEDQSLKKNLKVSCSIKNKHIAFTDRNIYDSVLQNLFLNAVKFSHKGGTIVIDSDQCGDFFKVSIQDTGIGMSNKTAQNLFKLEKIESTLGTENEKGTGLGLIICKELIERQGGKIEVESQQGRGSRFIFSVPVYKS